MTPAAERRSRATAAPSALRAPGVVTAVGPGSGLQVTPRDRSGGHDDHGDRRSTGTYRAVDNLVETNPIVMLLAEIAVALAAREREARARLHVVEDARS